MTHVGPQRAREKGIKMFLRHGTARSYRSSTSRIRAAIAGVTRTARIEPLEGRMLLSAGDLDPTFGAGGKALLPDSSGAAQYHVSADAVQTDRKIVLAGSVVNGSTSSFLLERVNADGTPDASFGTNGIVTGPAGGASSLLIQPDGKLLVGGPGAIPETNGTLPGGPLYLARYNADGSPDSTFGVNGVLGVKVTGQGAIESLALAPGGKILEAGPGTYQDPAHAADTNYSAQVFFAARYNADGSVDNSFNGTGYVYRQVDQNLFPGLYNTVAVTAQPDGKVVVGSGFKEDFAAWRFNADGSLDSSFGTGGMATTPFLFGSFADDNYDWGAISRMLVQPDQKILVAGPADYADGVVHSWVLSRYNTNGSLDTSFGTRGILSVPLKGYGGYPTETPFLPGGLALQSDGKILIGGTDPLSITYPASSLGPERGPFIVKRYLASGTADPSFNSPDINFYATTLGSVGATVLAPDGRIIVAGNVTDGSGNGGTAASGIGVVRLLGDTPVTGGPTPYLGHPFNIATDTIEAENFDNGGEGVSYHDTTPQNIGGAYRNTAVDISADATASNGYSVGWTAPGEWLDYTISVPATGAYTLQSRVANYLQGGTFHVEVDGANVTGTMTVPNTGPWDTWATLTSKSFTLTAGTHVMRVQMDQPGHWGNIADFDYFKFAAATQTGPTPYLGHPFNVDTDLINADNFDNGGEGVSYHDSTPQNIGGAYRNTAVDIGAESTAQNGYVVGWTAPGEWLDYSITVPQTGQYHLNARVASFQQGGTFHGEIDGANLTSTMTIPNTGPWDTWQTVSSQTFTLTAGMHVVRIQMDKGGYWGAIGDFDYFQFVHAGAAAAATPPAQPSDPPGDLDPSFGLAGRQLYSDPSPVAFPNSVQHRVKAVAVQSDGKIVLAGSIGLLANNGEGQFYLERLNADGTIDTSFGTNGEVETSFGQVAYATSILIQADGKIVVGGATADAANAPTTADFALARYTANGSLDPTFGSGGKVVTAFTGNEQVDSLALAPGGKIVAAGSYFLFPDVGFDLARYNADGSLDTTLNGNGMISVDLGQTGANFAPAAVAVQRDGKILIGSHAGTEFGVYRLNSNGTNDTSFAGTGVATTGSGAQGAVTALLIQPDGNIVAAGTSSYQGAGYAVVRFTATGSLDTGFGSGHGIQGVSRYPVGNDPLYPLATLILQADGKILVIGSQHSTLNPDPAPAAAAPLIRRLLADGTPDPSFHADLDPMFLPPPPWGSELAEDAALAPDGRIVLAADVLADQRSNSPHWIGVARYQNTVSVTTGPTPYLGHPFNINTDTIEAENFDNGGEGISYHDTTPQNLGGAYRNTAVDIGADSTASNGYSVGWVAPGEWLDYTISVPAAGTYTLQARVAAYRPGGTFHMEIDGANVTGAMTVPNSGPWDTWITITSKPFALAAGTHVMRIQMDTGGYWGAVGDFDSFKFAPAI